ncbi:MAG: hypothetical protein IJX91_01560 [Clostridia bacterium]|nr:hypothetical protein [Clostridia bacterium]
MSKQTRQQKKEEEKRIIAEMEEALRETKGESGAQQPDSEEKVRKSVYATEPEKIHCRRCKTLMENGVCPTCGYKMYVPMDEKKRNKIRFIAAIVLVVIGVIVFAISKM